MRRGTSCAPRTRARASASPLFKLFHRREEGWEFLAHLRIVTTDLHAYYKGIIRFTRRGFAWAIELWLGRYGIAFVWPSMRILLEHDEIDDASDREERRIFGKIMS